MKTITKMDKQVVHEMENENENKKPKSMLSCCVYAKRPWLGVKTTRSRHNKENRLHSFLVRVRPSDHCHENREREMVPSTTHHGVTDMNGQLSFETQAAHISHLRSLLFPQLSGNQSHSFPNSIYLVEINAHRKRKLIHWYVILFLWT